MDEKTEATKTLSVASQDVQGQTEVCLDPAREKRILRKFDYLVLPQFVVIILLAYLDRTNIGNARIFGFEESLNLKGNEFGNISTVFYATYALFEIPWVMVLHRLGANATLAIEIMLWSVITIGSGLVKTYGQMIAMRLLLGAAEAGMFPCITYTMSTIYPRETQGKRFAVMYGGTALSGAFGGLIAYGIQSMGDRHGLEDRKYMRDRAARISNSAPEEKISLKHVKMAFSDITIWIAGLSFAAAGIPLFGFGIFLPTIIRGFGYATLQINYLTIPCYLAACIILAVGTYPFKYKQYKSQVLLIVDKIGKVTSVNFGHVD